MEMVQKSGMYDDGLPIIRWRFPHQCAHWFGMTVLFGACVHLYKFQFVGQPVKSPENNKIPGAWHRVLCNKKEERKMKKTFD